MRNKLYFPYLFFTLLFLFNSQAQAQCTYGCVTSSGTVSLPSSSGSGTITVTNATTPSTSCSGTYEVMIMYWIKRGSTTGANMSSTLITTTDLSNDITFTASIPHWYPFSGPLQAGDEVKISRCVREQGYTCFRETTQTSVTICTPPGAPSISGTTTVAKNANYTYSVPSASGSTFSWDDDGGSGSSSTRTLTTSWSTSGSKNLCLTQTNSSGCAVTSCETITVENCEIPTINSFTGPTTGDINTNYTYTTSASGSNLTYYTFSSGGSPSYSTSSNFTTQWSSAGNKSVCVTVSENYSSTCAASACVNPVITACTGTPPSATISGNTSGGVGSSYTFTTPAISGVTFTWSAPGATTTSGSGTSFTTSWGSTGTKTVSVTATKTGCTTATDDHDITISSCQGATINSVSNTCTGTTVSVSAQDEGSGVTYSWNFGSGASPATATGLGPHNVSYSTAGSKSITLTTSKTYCSNATDTESLTVYTSPTANISGSTTGSPNTSYTFTTPSVSGATYTWTDNSGSGSSTTNSLNTSWSTGGTKTVCVTVSTGGGTCTDTDCHDITISSCPVASINSISNNCTGTSMSISADNQDNAATYAWNFGSGASPSTATGFGPHDVTYSTNGSKSVTLTVSKSGCSTVSDTETFTINQTPTVSLSGDATGNTGVAYSFTTTSVVGASYSWSYTATGSGSSSTNSIDITWSNSGSKTVEVTTEVNGCEATDSEVIVISSGPCYGSRTDFESYSVGTNMNGETLTDGAGTTIDIALIDNSSGVNDFKTDLTFARAGDTAILVDQDFANESEIRLIANTSLTDLVFCVRDVDMQNAGGNSIVDKIDVSAYQGSSVISITSSMYTANSQVIRSGNTFYGSADVASSSTNGDVCFEFSSNSVDSLVIGFENQGVRGSGTHDIAISNLEWCTSTALPVVWGDVKAVDHQEFVSIEWSTISEINNDYFIVERSENNSDFYAIGKATYGAGNTNAIQNYQLKDVEMMIAPVTYYRIKQVDFDGAFKYSNVVSVIRDQRENKINVFPYPGNDFVTLRSEITLNQPQITVTDLFGKIMYSKQFDHALIDVSLQTSNWRNGMYIVNITSSIGQQTQRIFIAH